MVKYVKINLMKDLNKHNLKKRVVVGMSGGVDSSVAAALLKEQGYDVIGIFMKLWAEKVDRTDLVRENICCSVEASIAARAVCEKLEIPFYVVNFEKEFKKSVVDYYINEYESGRTPNPCVICNRDIKSELLLKKADELNADFLATGHYARSIFKNKHYHLYAGIDDHKDQTYFLWTITAEKIKKLLFPVGDYKKAEIRELAVKFGLPTASRKESQGICFIPDRDVCSFMRRYAQNLTEPGPIIDNSGKDLGQHFGLINYTVGQRERLGLGGPKAYYAIRLNSQQNTLVVGDESELYQSELMASSLNWINPIFSDKKKEITVEARIRYGHVLDKCSIKMIDADKVKVNFKTPQRAITPGQSIVFYKNNEVLGGGVIE